MREDPERKRTEDHMGESWHNNHHAFPGSAKLGLYPGQIDLGFALIKVLERLGLA
jgi:stearoyl-CoA desaturase (delta-9 desaturase)